MISMVTVGMYFHVAPVEGKEAKPVRMKILQLPGGGILEAEDNDGEVFRLRVDGEGRSGHQMFSRSAEGKWIPPTADSPCFTITLAE